MGDDCTVGVIGLGKMGMPISRRLLDAGYDVHAVEPDRVLAGRAADLGIELHDTPAELGAAVRTLVVLVGGEDDVRSVCLEPDTGLIGCPTDRTIMICSTVLPRTVGEIAAAFRDGAGPRAVLDAPLCRGEDAAERGALLALIGGSPDVLERCRPVLHAFTSDHFLLGELGAGQVAKMINNALLWTTVVANTEGLLLGKRAGLDLDELRRALLQSSGANWALETWQRARDMPWAEKDMQIVVEHLADAGVDDGLSVAVQRSIVRLKAEKLAWQQPRTQVSMDEYLRDL